MSAITRAPESARINLRTSPEAKALIERADSDLARRCSARPKMLRAPS